MSNFLAPVNIEDLISIVVQSNQIMTLSSAVRFFLMIVYYICSVILAIDFARSLTVLKKDKLRLAYMMALAIGTIFLAVGRTPLVSRDYVEIAFFITGYLLVIPITFGLLYFIKSKKFILLVDLVVMIVNLPFFMQIEGWKFVYIASVGYYFVRGNVFSIDRILTLKNQPGRYMVKEGFDSLSSGIFFANSYGQISFINKAMLEYFQLLGIDEYAITSDICAQIEKIAADCGRRISNTSVLIYTDGRYLVFSWTLQQKVVVQMYCRNVTEEELILIDLNDAREKEIATQEELETALKNITSIETQKEVLRLKGNLHDVMAQRLSILHGIVNYDGFDDVDLHKIKELIADMMPEMYGGVEVSFQDRIAELVKSFALIGVTVEVSGDICGISSKSIVLKILRECTTNAVRHGGATKVFVHVEYGLDGYKMTITDNGSSVKNCVWGNGLTGMKYAVNSAGGSFTVENEQNFTVLVVFPE